MLRKIYILLCVFLGMVISFLVVGGVRAQAVNLQAPSSRAPTSGGQDVAYITVQSEKNDLITREISFSAPISGLLALQYAGLEVVTRDYGWAIAVCSINGVGCPATDCFCSNNYWSYQHWGGNAWQSDVVGASVYTITNGAIEGWAWTNVWPTSTLPSPMPLISATKALEWMKLIQEPDTGGYRGPSSSVEALMAIGANGYRAGDWRYSPDSPSLLQYWLANAAAYADKAAESGKLAVGLSAANACWPANTRQPINFYDPASGAYSDQSGFQAWAMLGTAALSQSVPGEASEYLKGMQVDDGGWEWNIGFHSDTNTTSLAIQALIASGESLTSTVVTDGLAYLKAAQNADGGFPYRYDSTNPSEKVSDANSTAYAIQAIRAAGQDPNSDEWIISGLSPLNFLASLQLPDNSFEWQKDSGSNIKATMQVIPALMGDIFPLRRDVLPACPSRFLAWIGVNTP